MRPTHLEPFGAERRQTSLASQAGPAGASTAGVSGSGNDISRRAAGAGAGGRSRDASYTTHTASASNMASHSYQSRGAATRRFEDSWISISSHPSSSSLATQNDIITTGLQLRRSTDRDRQARALQLSEAAPQRQSRSASATGSSQDEYEESESESDQVLSSSNEDMGANDTTTDDHGDEEEEEEDDSQTALGLREPDRSIFTPQPNAFSHPPSSRIAPHALQTGASVPTDSYFPPQHQTSPPHITSSHRLPSNRLPNIQRPSHHRTTSANITVDHDAALRASLTTLLSCANAVRKDRDPAPRRTTQQYSNQPAVLRLVPESELNSSPKDTPSQNIAKDAVKRRSRESSKDRQSKKTKAVVKPVTPEEVVISSTMLTWFSAGAILVVFSAISFSAGYAWGKEVGYTEAQLGLDGVSCGREAIRGSRTGLSKLRLGSV